MTPTEYRAKLANILKAAQKGDDESAHSQEDQLRRMVLEEIHAGHLSLEDARELSHIALSSEGIDFQRWCA